MERLRDHGIDDTSSEDLLAELRSPSEDESKGMSEGENAASCGSDCSC